MTFVLQAKTPGPHLDSEEVDLGVDFAAALGERQEAYERLIRDAIDGIAAALRPLRRRRAAVGASSSRPSTSPAPIYPYFRDTWGPSEADRVLGGDTWFEPS